MRAIEAELGTTATVGVGIPGTISPRTDLVKNANSTCLIGRPLGREAALTNLRTHIDGVAKHFRGRVKGWDVVNEAINDGGAIA